MDNNENNTINNEMNPPQEPLGPELRSEPEKRWDPYRQKPQNPAEPPKKNRKGLIIFLIILGVALLLLFVGGLAAKNAVNHYNPFSTQTEEYHYDTDAEHMALIDIDGEIGENNGTLYTAATYDQDWILEIIDDMEYEPANKGIILYLDTPGGSVYETDEVYLKLLEYKETTGNPVYAVMGPTCASGGYYISCAADKIYANRNTTTGSIGVTFGTMFDLSGLLADYNIKTNTITSGPNKAMGSSYEPMTDEQRAIFQSIIDEAYDQFTGIVAEGRHMDIAKAKQLADGRIYTAKQAKDAGLIDEVCSYNDAITGICEEVGIHESQIYEYEYYEHYSLFNQFFAMTSQLRTTDSQGQDLAAALKLAQQGELKPYYMMGH